MMDTIPTNYIALLTFLLTGIGFIFITFLVSKLLRPNNPDPHKLSIYECGEEATGGGQIQFNSRFFAIALLFVLFEVEILFLFPWAIVFSDTTLVKTQGNSLPLVALIEMLIFVGILVLGLAYAWINGHLDWVKPVTKATEIDYSIPMEVYDTFNKSA